MESGDDPTDCWLRDVFDLCDADRRGFITVGHFIELANAHFTTDDASQQDWDQIVTVLKANGNDRIDFPDFCLRIKQILELQEKSSSNYVDGNISGASTSSLEGVAPYEDRGSAQYNANKISDVCWASSSATMPSIFTHLRLSRNSSEECLPSMTEDATSSSLDAGAEVIVLSENQERAHVSLDEDYFEDNGQADITENHLQLPFHMALTPVSPRSLSSGGRLLTPSAVASQLYRGSSSVNMSSRSSFSEEMIQNIDDQSLQDLNDKIGQLQKRIDELLENQQDYEQRQLRMKEENFMLSEKLLVLEEQVRDTEQQSREQLIEQQKRHSELMERITKENSREVELLTLNLQSIQSEYQQFGIEVPVLMSENERLSRENSQLENESESLRKQLVKLREEHESLREHLHAEHNKMTHEQKVHRQLIHELTGELEELRLSKNEGFPSGAADLPRSLRTELENHIFQLKRENAALRSQRDDLHAQLLQQHFEEGRLLLNHRTAPLDAEMEKLPKTELIKVLQREVEANGKLREYVELITLRILEKNPSILEIGSMATT